jgi:hypothetical protein
MFRSEESSSKSEVFTDRGRMIIKVRSLKIDGKAKDVLSPNEMISSGSTARKLIILLRIAGS